MTLDREEKKDIFLIFCNPDSRASLILCYSKNHVYCKLDSSTVILAEDENDSGSKSRLSRIQRYLDRSGIQEDGHKVVALLPKQAIKLTVEITHSGSGGLPCCCFVTTRGLLIHHQLVWVLVD